MTAVMLGALVLHGLQPGPMLVFDQPVLVYGILAAFMLSNFVMLILQLYGVRIFVYITRIPVAYLLPIIILLGGIGGFALQNRIFDIWVVYVSGLIGYILAKTGFPLAPIILGAILGPIAETNFRRALITESDPLLFLTRPISGMFIALSLLSMAYPVYKHVRTMLSEKKREEAIGRATTELEVEL
jgi:putative tricarboxylic transport membrane protein